MAARTARTRSAGAAVALTLTVGTACTSGGGDSGDGAPPAGTPTATPATTPTEAPSPERTARATPELTGSAEVIVTGLDVPWGLDFLPDGTALVTERDTARLLRVAPDNHRVTEVQTIPGVHSAGEGGLLGIAVSPDYEADETIFVYYTTSGDNRIARLTPGGQPAPILTGIPRAGNHDGGRLAFGPDGYLYASTGDAADPPRSQDRDSLGGKILRMTAEGEPAPGNPFDSLVWSYGHRNVQGLAWDTGGNLWATEFGANDWDEINLVEPGNNYGWPEVEGPGGGDRFVDPAIAWRTHEASCSGAAVVGETLIAACLRGQRLWQMEVTEGGTIIGAAEPLLVEEYGRLRAAAVAPNGSLWVTTSNRDGRLAGGPAGDDDRIVRLGVTGEGPASRR